MNISKMAECMNGPKVPVHSGGIGLIPQSNGRSYPPALSHSDSLPGETVFSQVMAVSWFPSFKTHRAANSTWNMCVCVNG